MRQPTSLLYFSTTPIRSLFFKNWLHSFYLSDSSDLSHVSSFSGSPYVPRSVLSLHMQNLPYVSISLYQWNKGIHEFSGLIHTHHIKNHIYHNFRKPYLFPWFSSYNKTKKMMQRSSYLFWRWTLFLDNLWPHVAKRGLYAKYFSARTTNIVQRHKLQHILHFTNVSHPSMG